MQLESLLAVDIGGGTQDILLWRDGVDFENSVKLVLPSPTRVLAGRIDRATAQGRDIHLEGWLMGGGPMGRAVKRHLEAGLKVSATPRAAASMADDLQKVESMGVVISQTPPEGARRLFTTDLELGHLYSALAPFEVPPPQTLAVAVCDHGYSPQYSNRKFRFDQWERFLESGGDLAGLITNSPDEHMTRLSEVQAQAPGALVMDTAAAALWGALEDPEVAAMAHKGLCLVNLGNMHTVGFVVKQGRVLAIYEHHTTLLDAPTLADHIQRFIKGELSNQEVYDTRGHGCARLGDAPCELDGPVVITGPQRRLARDLGWRTAMPHGDVMLSGCFGLLAAAKEFYRAA